MANKGNNKGYYAQGFKGKRVYCDICGLGFYESETAYQDGYRKCIVGPTRCMDEQEHPDDRKYA